MSPILTEQDHIRDLREFDKHSFISFVYDNESGLEGFVAIHRKNQNIPSFGATRMWNYVSDVEALKDALRLSRLMSYKSALAGLECGGAKGVIMSPSSNFNRTKILESYAGKINFIKDHFVTGTDVGLTQDDLNIMKKLTPNIVGFNDNSTDFTALGIFYSITCCLKELFSNDSIENRTFAIQGLGKVGSELLKLIYKDAAKIYVSDINPDTVKEIQKKYPNISAVSPEEIHKQKVDVFSPCALSHSLNDKSITELQCKMIVGGANNQLQNESIGNLLFKLGILYAPDYVVNAGGLIAVYDEFEHKKYDVKKVSAKVFRIKETLSDILTKSRELKKPTNVVANEVAEKIFNSYS